MADEWWDNQCPACTEQNRIERSGYIEGERRCQECSFIWNMGTEFGELIVQARDHNIARRATKT